MTLLSVYLMRAILTSTLLVMMVLLALAGLFEFIGQLDSTEGNFGTPQALLFALLRLPQLCFEMLPIGTLIGSLLGLGSLANNSELVVMRTAGLSVAVRVTGAFVTNRERFKGGPTMLSMPSRFGGRDQGRL